MKKLILIIALLSSCGYSPISQRIGIVITRIENYKEGDHMGCWCNYYGEGDVASVKTATSWDFKFTDSCGRFQIGDTIIFVKK